MQWNIVCDWNKDTKGCKLFRKVGEKNKNGRVVLCSNKVLDYKVMTMMTNYRV